MSTGIGWATARSSRRWRRERAEGWNEIVRSRRFLGENTSKEDREELLKLTTSELTSTAQVLASAVHLRQQVETAEFTRALIEQQKAAQQPPGGPLAC